MATLFNMSNGVINQIDDRLFETIGVAQGTSGATPSTLKVTFLSWAMGSSISTTSWATGAISKRFKADCGNAFFWDAGAGRQRANW